MDLIIRKYILATSVDFKKLGILIFWLVGICIPAESIGQERSTFNVIKNYRYDWSVTHESNWYFSPVSVTTEIDLSYFPEAILRASLPAETALLLNEEIELITKTDTTLQWRHRELSEKLGVNKAKLVLHGENISLDEVQIASGFFMSKSSSDREIMSREQSYFSDFLILAAIIILLSFVIIRSSYPASFNAFFNPFSFFSVEALEEGTSRGRFFTLDFVLILGMIHLLLGLSVMVGLQVNDYFYNTVDYTSSDALVTNLGVWLLISLGFIAVAFAKYLFLSFFGYIYQFGILVKFHYLFLLKMINFFMLLALVVFCYLSVNHLYLIPDFWFWTIRLGFVWYFASIFILFIYLKQNSGFNNIHIISYLCTAELIPVVILMKIFIG